MAIIVEITNETDRIVSVKTFHLPDNALSDDEGDRLIESVGDQDDGFERVITKATVRKLLAFASDLTMKEQAILRLTYWDEASDDEIAQALKVSPSRVKQLRHMAIVKLRHLARKWGLL